MHDRRQTLTERLFSDIVSNKDHALHSLLPKVNCARPLRSNRCFNVPICKTNRFKNSFIMCKSSNCLESKSLYIVNSFLFSIIVFYRNSILLNCKIFVFVKSTVIQPMAANFRLLINHLLAYLILQASFQGSYIDAYMYIVILFQKINNILVHISFMKIELSYFPLWCTGLR